MATTIRSRSAKSLIVNRNRCQRVLGEGVGGPRCRSEDRAGRHRGRPGSASWTISQVFDPGHPGAYRQRVVLRFFPGWEDISPIEIEDRGPRPVPETPRQCRCPGGRPDPRPSPCRPSPRRAGSSPPRGRRHTRRTRRPTRRRVVIAAAEVDGDPVLQGQAAGQEGSTGGVPHRSQHPPVDRSAGQPADNCTSKMRASASSDRAIAGIPGCGA